MDRHAVRAGMTVRNVRSHVSRGLLLPPPQLRGRTAYYGADHVARLQLIAMAAACASVAVRLWIGRGGPLFAVGFYVFVCGGVALIVGPFLGEPFPTVPLYLAEALCVELAVLLLVRRPLALGAVAGLFIGTVGFAAEYAWTQLAFRVPGRPTSSLRAP